ncbi:MAG: DUF4083 family protein [Syntrophomonadaceae bacterium]|jgi:large-conductance mechanosensitive channel
MKYSVVLWSTFNLLLILICYLIYIAIKSNSKKNKKQEEITNKLDEIIQLTQNINDHLSK